MDKQGCNRQTANKDRDKQGMNNERMIVSFASLFFPVCFFCPHHLRIPSLPSAFIILRFFPSPNLSLSLLCHLCLPPLLSFSLPPSVVSSVALSHLFPQFSVSSFHLCCSPISLPHPPSLWPTTA